MFTCDTSISPLGTDQDQEINIWVKADVSVTQAIVSLNQLLLMLNNHKLYSIAQFVSWCHAR